MKPTTHLRNDCEASVVIIVIINILYPIHIASMSSEKSFWNKVTNATQNFMGTFLKSNVEDLVFSLSVFSAAARRDLSNLTLNFSRLQLFSLISLDESKRSKGTALGSSGEL